VTPWFLGSKLTVPVNCCAVSSATVAGFGATETAMAAKVICTDPCFVESLAEVTWMVTGTSLGGGVAGAVYVTVVLVGLLRVPTAGAGEVILQVVGSTPLFAGSKLTVAVISEVLPAGQEGGAGQASTGLTDAMRETEMAAKSMFSGADCVGSATDVAVIVSCTSLGGGVAGAL
jgi:hypothetical protein